MDFSGDNFVKVSERQQLYKIGRTNKDIHKYFTSHQCNRKAMYCPPPNKCNSNYWVGLLTRRGHFMWQKDVVKHNCPDVQEFNEVECATECAKHPECVKYWPPSFYRKGENEGYLVFPGKQFALDIFLTLKPEEFKTWRAAQMVKYAARLDKSEPGGLEVPEEELEAMEAYGKVHYGQTGICSNLWYASNTESRENKAKEKWEKEFHDNLVGENIHKEAVMDKMTNNTLADEELVPAKYIKEVYNEYKVVHDDNVHAFERTLLIPYQVCETIQDPQMRKSLYTNMISGYENVYPGLVGKFKC